MPNWCDNNVTLKHKDSAMIKRAYDAFGRNEFQMNSFQFLKTCLTLYLEVMVTQRNRGNRLQRRMRI